MHILRGFSTAQFPSNRSIDKKGRTTQNATLTMSHSAPVEFPVGGLFNGARDAMLIQPTLELLGPQAIRYWNKYIQVRQNIL